MILNTKENYDKILQQDLYHRNRWNFDVWKKKINYLMNW